MSVTDYPVPCDSWLPTLWDIQHYKTLTGAIGEYYSRFGFENLVVDEDRFPRVSEVLDRLTVRFNEHYADRMIGQETMERWQLHLQSRLDEILPRFEYMYKVYEMTEELRQQGILPGVMHDMDYYDQNSGSDTTSGTATDTTKDIDTPDQAINADDNYADRLTKGSSSRSDTATYGRKIARKGYTHDVTTGSEFRKDLNEQADQYRDIDTLFVNEFNICFLGVYQ